MSQQRLSTLHAFLLACSVLGILFVGIAAGSGAANTIESWQGAIYLAVALAAFTMLFKLLTPK